jgi:integrase
LSPLRQDRRRQERFHLIKADFASPERAREAAILAVSKLKLEGIEPSVAKRAERAEAIAAKVDTFAALAAKFDELNPQLSESDQSGRRVYLARYILPRIGKKHFKDVTTYEIRQLVRDVQQAIANSDRAQKAGWTGQDGANLCQFIIRRIYTFAVAEKWTTENPASFEQISPNNREKRYEKFDCSSFAALWNLNYERVVSGRDRINTALSTLIYLATLQRPIDIARSRRQDIDLEKSLWIVPQWMMKKPTRGRPSVVRRDEPRIPGEYGAQAKVRTAILRQ